jgi:hypothetical protein
MDMDYFYLDYGVTLIMGHLDFNLGDFQIISSLNEFAKVLPL